MAETKRTPDAILAAWYERARQSKQANYEAARRFSHLNYALGIPVIVISSIVASSTFAALTLEQNLALRIVTGFLSVAAAVLASLQTFLKYSERSEKHRAVAARYGAVCREIEHTQAYAPLPEEHVLSRIRDRLDSLATEAPGLTAGVRRFAKDQERDTDS